MPRIVGILLAAGRGTRFGGDKLLAPLPHDASELAPRGTPVGAAAGLHLVRALRDSIAVTRADDTALTQCLRDAGLRTVPCVNADEGMGATLACGVAAAADADAWIIALADMPWITPGTIRGVADALASGADIAAPSYRGARGHPVGFAKRHYPALASLTGDAGARAILAQCGELITWLDVDDAGVVRDVDTPEHLASG